MEGERDNGERMEIWLTIKGERNTEGLKNWLTRGKKGNGERLINLLNKR